MRSLTLLVFTTFDPDLKQFAHPVDIVFATPTGAVSSYLLGVGYQPAAVQMFH